MMVTTKEVVLILAILVCVVSSAERDELSVMLQEEQAFWGRALLRGAASMSYSMPVPTPAPPPTPTIARPTPPPPTLMPVSAPTLTQPTETPPTAAPPTTAAPVPPTIPPPTIPPSSNCEIFYGLSSTISTIDVSTETQTTLGEFLSRTPDIAYDVEEGTIRYVRPIDVDEEFPEEYTLCQLDPVSLEEIGCVGEFPGPITALQHVNGIFYGIYADEEDRAEFSVIQSLVTIDKSGRFTKIGLTGTERFDDLAYDASTGTLWGLRNNAGCGQCAIRGELYKIDLTSGVATFVAVLSELSYVYSIEFGPDGRLYGNLGARGPPISFFFRIDDTSTGEVTILFESENGVKFRGLTCGPLPASSG